MSDAAHEHLQTVVSARAEAQTFHAAAEGLSEHVTTAAAGVTAAINTLAEAVAALAAQGDVTKTAVEATCIAADNHTAHTVATGHDTLEHVIAAQERCAEADTATEGSVDFVGNLHAVVEHAKTEAIDMVMGVIAQVTEFAGGVSSIDARLDQAETSIRNTIRH